MLKCSNVNTLQIKQSSFHVKYNEDVADAEKYQCSANLKVLKADVQENSSAYQYSNVYVHIYHSVYWWGNKWIHGHAQFLIGQF